MIDAQRVFASELRIGMYVSSLDRPWLETPFLVQGFFIESNEDIAELAKYCDYVYVDQKISKSVGYGKNRPLIPSPDKPKPVLFQNKKLKVYQDSITWQEEYPKAKEAVTSLSSCVTDILGNAEKGGPLEVAKIKLAVEPMIDSISRNPDACIWLARMKQEDNYTYQHSLGASIWAVALGRQLGLPKADLRTLAIGGLLFDVGKLKLDKELLHSNRRLTEDEFTQVKQHVELGVESLQESGVINPDIMDMVSYHHERHNGSGYPNGISGDQIPVFARIAAIVDCYDAITSHRIYAKALPPSVAIKKLYEWKDIDFQGELIEEFIQAIGIYPAGTLVELSSGEVAIVVAEYRSRRLRPQVMVMLDKDKTPLDDIRYIDLLSETTMDDGGLLEIVNSLEADAYGIDISAIEL